MLAACPPVPCGLISITSDAVHGFDLRGAGGKGKKKRKRGRGEGQRSVGGEKVVLKRCQNAGWNVDDAPCVSWDALW